METENCPRGVVGRDREPGQDGGEGQDATPNCCGRTSLMYLSRSIPTWER